MHIILMRHTDSLTRQQAGVPYDADRPLSPLGREHARAIGRYLSSIDCVPNPIVCSPFVRTQECAALITEGLGGETNSLPLTMLAPGSSTNELLKAAQYYAEAETEWMLAVMHEPDVSHILSNLLFDGAVCPIPVQQGDLFGMNIESGHGHSRGRLVFYMSPSAMQVPEKVE